MSTAGPRTLALVTLLCLGCPALAQDHAARAERKRQRLREKVARKLRVPLEALESVGGERYAARDPAPRRALLEALGRAPDGRLLPLVVDAALHEPDFTNRVAAVKLLDVVGLEADRELVAGCLLAQLPRLLADEQDEVFLGAADAALLLQRWLELDTRLAPLWERAFRGKNYRLAQKAYAGLVALRPPALRDGPGREALLEVLSPKTRFSVFERKRAVLEAGRRPGLRRPAQLAELLFEDGTVAIECVQALADLGDPSVLPALRRVDRTASHALRKPTYLARARLGDEELFAELEQVFEHDHVEIRRTLIRALGVHPDPRADEVLGRVAELEQGNPDLRQEVAVARLARGDAADLDLLAEALRKGDKALAGRLLDLEARASAPLVLQIAASPKLGAQRERAVDRVGAWGLQEGLGPLRELAKAPDPSALRLRAAVSLLELGAPEGIAAVHSALQGLEVVARENVKTGAGKPARRYRGSVLVDVCRGLPAAHAWRGIALIAPWLDPPVPAAPAAPPPRTGEDTSTRRQPAAPPPAPEPPAWLKHPLVRRGVVRALGELVAGLAEADPAPADAADLHARGVAALARSLGDPAAVVRSAALHALARISGRAELPPAAGPDAEEQALPLVQAWLAEQR